MHQQYIPACISIIPAFCCPSSQLLAFCEAARVFVRIHWNFCCVRALTQYKNGGLVGKIGVTESGLEIVKQKILVLCLHNIARPVSLPLPHHARLPANKQSRPLVGCDPANMGLPRQHTPALCALLVVAICGYAAFTKPPAHWHKVDAHGAALHVDLSATHPVSPHLFGAFFEEVRRRENLELPMD